MPFFLTHKETKNMIRFPFFQFSKPSKFFSSSLISSSCSYYSLRSASSSVGQDEIPSIPEVISAFKTFGFHGSNLHDISKRSSSVDEASIKKKFIELAKQQHPDVAKSNDAKVNMSEINSAYKILKNFFKAGGFSKFGSHSQQQQYYKNQYSSSSSNYSSASDVDGEYFWSGFEDVLKNSRNQQQQHPNTFYTNNANFKNTSKSSKNVFGDEEEFIHFKSAEAAAAAEFFARHAGESAEFSPEDMFEMLRRYQNPNFTGSGSSSFNQNPFYSEFTAGGGNVKHDDAQTMREAEQYFYHYNNGNMMGDDSDDTPFFRNDGVPLDFVEFDLEDLPPHMFEQFMKQQQQQQQQQGGGSRRFKKNNNRNHNHYQNLKRRNNNNKKKQPWMNPDDFFEEGFANPQKQNNFTSSSSPHHSGSNNQNQNQQQQQQQEKRNAAGEKLSNEEYEAILTMHGDGRSFSFIANALGLSEKQAIAGFNIAKKKESEFKSTNQNSHGHNKTKNNEEKTTATSKAAANHHSNHNEFVKDDSTLHTTAAATSNSKAHSSEQVFDVDDDEGYDDVANPQPFNGKPLHHHSKKTSKSHHNNFQAKTTHHNHGHHHNNNQNRNQKSKWRRRKYN